MTDDYKQNLLKWLTGNYTTSSPSNDENWEYKTVVNNLRTNLINLYGGTYTVTNILTGKDITNNGLNLSVLIVETYTANVESHIIILDENFNILNTYDNYASGQPIEHIESLNCDSEGNFYGIEFRETTNAGRSLILLNNFLITAGNTYKLRIRKRYMIPESSIIYDYYHSTVEGMVKSPNDSRYVVYGILAYEGYQGTYALQIKLQFGEDPEYTSALCENEQAQINDCIVEWGDEEINKLYLLTGDTNSSDLVVKLLRLNGDVLTPSTLLHLEYDENTQYSDFEGKFINVNKIVCDYSFSTLSLGENLRTCRTSYIDINNDYTGTETQLFTNFWNTLTGYARQIQIIDENRILFLWVSGSVVLYRISGTSRILKNVYIGAQRDSIFIASVMQQYNLLKYRIQFDNDCRIVTMLYNPNNYNGIPVRMLDSMVANSGVLRNGGDIVFARNLYNKIISNNTTTSTLEVPNVFLNDMAIENEELYSVRNNVMNNMQQQITKNIYERLYINFIDTINIENRNNIDNVVYNNIGASRLNRSTSQDQDYSSARITKYRINYKDGTSSVNNFTIPTISGNSATYNFNVSTGTGINTIEFLSNDGNTVYHTIDCRNLDNNKTYNIQQRVSIE